jgi:hypothetical protein
MAPAAPESQVAQAQETVRDRASEIKGALADYELDNLRTQGAPQQAVVNGWVAKDLLTIIAEQQNEALTRDEVPPPVVPNDERIPALVGLVVLGLALVVATSPRPNAAHAVAEPALGEEHRDDALSAPQPA